MNRHISTKLIAAMMAFGAFPAFAESGASEVVSEPQIKCTDALKGFTIGADVAYNYSEAKHDGLVANFNPSGIRGHGLSSDGIKHRRCNIDPSINIGYTHLHNNWYMGAAGDFSFGKKGKRNTSFYSDATVGDVTADTRISGFSGGIKLKGGYYISGIKSAAYGIAGIKWRDVDSKFNVSGIEGSKAKLKRPLFVLGLGLEKPVYKKLSVSAEYEYAWRNSNDTSVVNLPNNATASLDVKQRLNDHSFKIGVKYHI